MMSLTEKLAYIKGLCEGLELEGTTKEGKVLLALVDLLDDVTDTVSQVESDVDQIFDEIDAIDEDLTDVEDALLYDDDEDYDEDECDCGHHHGDDEDEDWNEDEDPIYEITCPNCGEVVCMNEDMLFSPDCACPKCGTSFEIDFDDEDCDCDCDDCKDKE
ncbi:MAG: hypothetical protein RR253_02530 [Oscillospiraceae bacterium]